MWELDRALWQYSMKYKENRSERWQISFQASLQPESHPKMGSALFCEYDGEGVLTLNFAESLTATPKVEVTMREHPTRPPVTLPKYDIEPFLAY